MERYCGISVQVLHCIVSHNIEPPDSQANRLLCSDPHWRMIETVRAIFKCGLGRQHQATAIIDVSTPGCAACDKRQTGACLRFAPAGKLAHWMGRGEAQIGKMSSPRLRKKRCGGQARSSRLSLPAPLSESRSERIPRMRDRQAGGTTVCLNCLVQAGVTFV